MREEGNNVENHDLRFKTVETFISINGEGMYAGELAYFIRFKGCNLDCSYCDTRWANQDDTHFTEESVGSLVAGVMASGIRRVTLTGGEPLLQDNLELLVDALLKSGVDVEIETNGSVPILPFKEKIRSDQTRGAGSYGKLRFTLDFKLPGSGMTEFMWGANASFLSKEDAMKYVCASLEDVEVAMAHVKKHELVGRTNVLISAVFGSVSHDSIVERMIDEQLNGVRLQLQMHKYIWNPEARGV